MKFDYPPVLTKNDFVNRYNLEEFGNRAPTWQTLDGFLMSGYQGLIHIRNRIAGGRTWYDVPARWVLDVFHNEVLPSGLTPEQVYFSAMAPTEKTILQGEVMQGEKGLELFYTQVRKPMRDALREESHTTKGLRAHSLLRKYMDDKSYEWLNVLLDRYQWHVIEFSTYSVKWGSLETFNSVFWEVRLY